MSEQSMPKLDPDTQAMLDCLCQVAAKTLERKRRLGHYAVIWENDAPQAIGDDAPIELQQLQPTPAPDPTPLPEPAFLTESAPGRIG
jgi:hypothetical protein